MQIRGVAIGVENDGALHGGVEDVVEMKRAGELIDDLGERGVLERKIPDAHGRLGGRCLRRRGLRRGRRRLGRGLRWNGRLLSGRLLSWLLGRWLLRGGRDTQQARGGDLCREDKVTLKHHFAGSHRHTSPNMLLITLFLNPARTVPEGDSSLGTQPRRPPPISGPIAGGRLDALELTTPPSLGCGGMMVRIWV